MSHLTLKATPHSDGKLAYITTRYQLGSSLHESTMEVWKTQARWAITSGSTGRLDVISPATPHVRIANVDVTTLLTQPRISGGTPSAGHFEVPPGIYTVTTGHSVTPVDEIHIAVPAMRRDGTPITATLTPPPSPTRDAADKPTPPQ